MGTIQGVADTALEAEATALAQGIAERAAKKAADETQAETDRINNSWNTFITNQDSVVADMRDNSISFEDVIVGLADSFGISTTDMALKAARKWALPTTTRWR